MMKKQSVSLLAILLTVSVFLFSCHDKMSKNTGSLQFDSIRVNETAHLFGDTANPACNITILFTYPTKSTDEKLKETLATHFVAAVFGCKYMDRKPEESVKQYTQDYIDDYRRDLEPTFAEDKKNNDAGAWYSYYKNIEGRVQLYEKDLLVYAVYYNEYTGGAHGMYMTTYQNMDLVQTRPLTLDDIFTGDYNDKLTDLIWSQLMSDNKVTTREALEDLGYGVTGDIAPIENFYLSKEGITFYYNVYDIAPYSMGPVRVTLPYDMIEHLLGSKSILRNLAE